MNREYTDISIVLDRSGSMGCIRKDVIGGFNTFIQGQKELSLGKCRVSLYQFDHEYETVFSGRDVNEVEELTLENYVPRGSTALLDALGKTINDTGRRLRNMKEEDRPGTVTLVVITDGEENASVEFTKDKIFQMIDHQKTKYNWDVVYIGANQDAITVAKDFGVTNAFNFSSSHVGTQNVFRSLSTSYADVRSQAYVGNVRTSMSISADDQKKMMETN